MVAARHVAFVAAELEVGGHYAGVDCREASRVFDDAAADGGDAGGDLRPGVAVDAVGHVVDQRFAERPGVDRALGAVAVLAKGAVLAQRVDRADAKAVDLRLTVGFARREPGGLGGGEVLFGGRGHEVAQLAAQGQGRKQRVAVGGVGDVGVGAHDVLARDLARRAGGAGVALGPRPAGWPGRPGGTPRAGVSVASDEGDAQGADGQDSVEHEVLSCLQLLVRRKTR